MNAFRVAHMERSTSRTIVTPQRQWASVHIGRRGSVVSGFGDEDVELPDGILGGRNVHDGESVLLAAVVAGER